MLKLLPNSILILLIVPEKKVWQRHLYSQTETLFEPISLMTTSIAQVYSPPFTRELGTKKAYYETYAFWTNPENIITYKDLTALYWQWGGEDIVYYEAEEEIGQVWYVGYYSDRRCSSPEFEIPQV